MRKVCVIGDSHAGVIMPSHISAGMTDLVELTFFTGHKDLFKDIQVDGQRLVPNNQALASSFKFFSRGSDCIDISNYDEFVIIGLNFGQHIVIRKYWHFSFDSMINKLKGRYLLSDECYLADSISKGLSTDAFKLASFIRSISDKKIVVVPLPRPGYGLTEERVLKGYDPVYSIVRDGNDVCMARMFAKACDSLAEAGNVDVLRPIEVVAKNGVFNKFEFSQLTDFATDESNDKLMNAMVHGNAAYGQHLVKCLFLGA